MLGLGDGLYRTSAAGSAPLERVTPPPDPKLIYIGPWMLPDGKAVLFLLVDTQQRVGHVALFDLATGQQKILVEGAAEPRYVPSGHLVYSRGTTLFAVPFDVPTRTITGPEVAVQEGVSHPALLTATDYAVSREGTLVYVPVPAEGVSVRPTGMPVWVDRTGRQSGAVVEGTIPNPRVVRLSPEGRRLVVQTSDLRPQGDSALWVYDLTGRPPIPLVDRAVNTSPLWSTDGTRIVFTSNQSGPFGVYSVPAVGGAPATPVRLGVERPVRGIPSQWAQSWMPDGRLIFTMQGGSGGSDLLIAPLDAGSAEPLVQTEYGEGFATVSPDGRWVAYRSNRTSRQEILVRAVAGGAPVRVSQNGGTEPLWSPKGNELFYREGSKLMAVSVKPGTAEFAFTPATMLFDQPLLAAYDVAADGRFVMIPFAGPPGPPPTPPGMVVVQNWVEELKRLVPVP